MKMLIRRTPRTQPPAMAPIQIPTTIWTKNGLPFCASEDEAPELKSFSDPEGGTLEPLADRMVAIDMRGNLWFGIGDGEAIPMPALIVRLLQQGSVELAREEVSELIAKALHSLDADTDTHGTVKWGRPAAAIVTAAILEELGLRST